MNQTEHTMKVLFSLIQSEICGKELDGTYLDDLSNETMEQLYKITKSHDIAHLVASALNKQKLLAQDELKWNSTWINFALCFCNQSCLSFMMPPWN